MRIHSLAVASFLLVYVMSSHAATRVLSVPDAFTPVVVRYVGDNTGPVRGSDGRWHVVYELWLSNARPVPASVERIEVLDYDQHGRVLAALAGDALLANMRDLSLRPAVDASLPPSTSKLVFVELTFDERRAVPEAIVHRLSGTGASSPAAHGPQPLRYLAAAWDLTRRTPPVIGAPTRRRGLGGNERLLLDTRRPPRRIAAGRRRAARRSALRHRLGASRCAGPPRCRVQTGCIGSGVEDDRGSSWRMGLSKTPKPQRRTPSENS